MLALAVVFGAVVGLSLGLTGGGGSIFAVPLLVYGLGVAPREAVGVSLAAVGATALSGAAQRLWRREIEVPTGLLFAAAGMAGAPLGAWIGRRAPEALLLLSFAALMLWVAARMWLKAVRRPEEAAVVRSPTTSPDPQSPGPPCRRDPVGKLRITSRCAQVMLLSGVLTGVLSGLFGVGGGFVIVPALVLFTGMGIHRAVATSLMVIALVSAAGLASYLAAGQRLDAATTGLFVAGGVAGMAAGTWVGRGLSPVRLQKVFAVVIVAVALFVIVKNVA
jgi:uncharacterized membrane protein YfcA